MANSRWRLTIRDSFSASHMLRDYPGKCERLHGHNFGVEAEVVGTRVDPETGMLLDFKDIKALLKKALEPLDHSHLNEVEPFDRVNPSSENLARHIHETLSGLLAEGGHGDRVSLARVTVSEKPTQSATFETD